MDRARTVVLLGLFAVSGALDALSFLTYKAFVAAQTGNLILLPLALFAGLPALAWQASGASIGGFVIGAVAGGRLVRGRDRDGAWRTMTRVTLPMESALIALAALAWTLTNRGGSYPWLVLGILAIGLGLQASLARAISHRGFNSLVVTVSLTSLTSGSRLGADDAGWRAGAMPVVMVLAGASAGAIAFATHVPLGVCLAAIAVAVAVLAVVGRSIDG